MCVPKRKWWIPENCSWHMCFGVFHALCVSTVAFWLILTIGRNIFGFFFIFWFSRFWNIFYCCFVVQIAYGFTMYTNTLCTSRCVVYRWLLCFASIHMYACVARQVIKHFKCRFSFCLSTTTTLTITRYKFNKSHSQWIGYGFLQVIFKLLSFHFRCYYYFSEGKKDILPHKIRHSVWKIASIKLYWPLLYDINKFVVWNKQKLRFRMKCSCLLDVVP